MNDCLILHHSLFARACVSLPLSKSMAARILVISYLSGRKVETEVFPDADDTRELASALERLEAFREKKTEEFVGFDLGLGATSLRFFIPIAASASGMEMLIDCAPGLRRRPLSALVEALNQLGASVEYAGETGHAPLFIKGRAIAGGELAIPGDVSSQFVSALLLVAPVWPHGLELNITGPLLSRLYVGMTIRMMEKAGARLKCIGNSIKVYPEGYSPVALSLNCEADWSAASYFYELALVHPDREIKFLSLCPPEESLQGDSRCAEIFKKLGVSTSFNEDGSAIVMGNSSEISRRAASFSIVLDAADIPDLVPALAVGMTLAGIPYRIENVPHLRVKESDRIAVLCKGLRSLGYNMKEGIDFMEWSGDCIEGESYNKTDRIVIDPEGDHRMAMAFAIAAGSVAELEIKNPGCVSKSFPDFWQQLEEG